ncbi:Uu.00g126250.m01.CDS01 [Anthostomella pinea]|uniref:Uu.00g126250.m01.CDS01 n=1 Tax=Anthostomella pinea TaxID=933095 RepID=A0AAI8VIL6_9PEZI|nr:Uu.00g126250.m01.CDS01 [Anthostomella pinea]
MPNVLILGGSGYLGFALGQALIRSGNYTVFGTVRSDEKAKTLTLNEVTPVKGEATNPRWLAQAIATHHIDVVVDTTQAYEQAGTMLGAVVQAAKDRAATLAKDNATGPKLGFVYTSGSWVNGSPSRRISDLTVPGTSVSPSKPATAVTWRPAHEQAILAARGVLDVAVLRPGTIYGRGSWVLGTHFGPLLEAAKSGSADVVHVPVDAGSRAGYVHVDDLSSAYVTAIDRLGRLGSWPIFEVATETLPIGDVLSAVASILNVKGKIAYDGTIGNPFLEALALVTNTDFSRAHSVLDWTPRRRDFIQNLPVLVAAWKATQA